MKINLTTTAMWAAITVLGLFSQYMSTQILVYALIVAFVVTVIKS
jgi:hypothetical protein